MRRTKSFIILVSIIIIAVAVMAVALYEFNPLGGSKPQVSCDINSSSSVSSKNNSTVYITIIESDNPPYQGMNGSAFHSIDTPWPVVTVHQGQTVVICVTNQNSSEPHGFAIAHYYEKGVELRPGESYTLPPFVADQVGEFRMYCNVFCVYHQFMQNGQLIVAP